MYVYSQMCLWCKWNDGSMSKKCIVPQLPSPFRTAPPLKWKTKETEKEHRHRQWPELWEKDNIQNRKVFQFALSESKCLCVGWVEWCGACLCSLFTTVVDGSEDQALLSAGMSIGQWIILCRTCTCRFSHPIVVISYKSICQTARDKVFVAKCTAPDHCLLVFGNWVLHGGAVRGRALINDSCHNYGGRTAVYVYSNDNDRLPSTEGTNDMTEEPTKKLRSKKKRGFSKQLIQKVSVFPRQANTMFMQILNGWYNWRLEITR